MSATSRARREFAKEQELEKLRAAKATREAVKVAQDAQIAALPPDQQIQLRARIAKTKNRNVLVFWVIVLFFAVIIFLASGGNKSSTSPGITSTSMSFAGSVAGVTLVNPASVNVSFSIYNTGTSAGIPNCTVRVQDPSGAYSGFDSPVISTPIEIGGTLNGNMNIIVTGQGASYITEGKVECH